MRKNGFTLLEVLITISIVGIIAALSMSALVKNTNKAHIGPSLAKFVSSFENAAGQLIQEERIDKLSDLGNFTNNVMPKLEEHLIVTPLGGNSSNYSYKSPDGSNPTAFNNAFQTNDGSIFDVSDTIPTPSTGAGGSYLGAQGVIILDINGAKGTGKAGTETFMFIVDDSGKLIPWGSKTHRRLSDGEITACSLTSSNAMAGFACTGRIADNGWRVE